MTLLVHILQYRLHLSEITNIDNLKKWLIMTDTDYRTYYRYIINLHY